MVMWRGSATATTRDCTTRWHDGSGRGSRSRWSREPETTRRVIDQGYSAFYLRLCSQSITLELFYLLGSTSVRVTSRVTDSWLRARRLAVTAPRATSLQVHRLMR